MPESLALVLDDVVLEVPVLCGSTVGGVELGCDVPGICVRLFGCGTPLDCANAVNANSAQARDKIAMKRKRETMVLHFLGRRPGRHRLVGRASMPALLSTQSEGKCCSQLPFNPARWANRGPSIGRTLFSNALDSVYRDSGSTGLEFL